MKNQNHIALLIGFFVSLVLYILLFFWDVSVELSELQVVLRLSVSAVPAFCLQLWLCRLKTIRWARWLPLSALLLLTLIGAAYFFGGNGWDTLGGAVILCWCIAPAAGCALGWLAYGGKLSRRLGTAGLAALLVVYAGLKIMGAPDHFFFDSNSWICLPWPLWLQGHGCCLGKESKRTEELKKNELHTGKHRFWF